MCSLTLRCQWMEKTAIQRCVSFSRGMCVLNEVLIHKTLLCPQYKLFEFNMSLKWSYLTHVTHFSGTYYQLPLVMCGRINTLYIIVNVTSRSENNHSNVSVD